MQNTGTKSRTALLGGSFNPVHMGHLYLMHEAYLVASISKIIVIPALLSNFKRLSHPLSFEERMIMLSLAREDYRERYPSDRLEIEISPVEKERGGISYTSETVKYFFDEVNDGGRVNFIMGDDLLINLEKWHDYEYLKDHVRFICFTRDGNLKGPKDAVIEIYKTEPLISSSTDIRNGNYEMLTRRVRKYVEDNGLYRAEEEA